jgi:hypothetical protein
MSSLKLGQPPNQGIESAGKIACWDSVGNRCCRRMIALTRAIQAELGGMRAFGGRWLPQSVATAIGVMPRASPATDFSAQNAPAMLRLGGPEADCVRWRPTASQAASSNPLRLRALSSTSAKRAFRFCIVGLTRKKKKQKNRRNFSSTVLRFTPGANGQCWGTPLGARAAPTLWLWSMLRPSTLTKAAD